MSLGMDVLAGVIRDKLRGHPNEMFVTNEYIAVMDADEKVYIFLCETKGKTPEELNQMFQNFMNTLIKRKKAFLN